MRHCWITAWRAGALVIVVVMAAANVIHTARKVPPPPTDVPGAMVDPIVGQEARYARLRESVQARGLRGAIGYFGDLAVADDDYFYAQFVLVPLVIDFDPEPFKWAVANLRTSSPETRLPAGWCVVEDFGDGVLLVKKSAP